MNNKAAIDQIITSIIVFVIAFFLSLFFVIISTNISSLNTKQIKSTHNDFSNLIDSRVMLEMFLTEKIEIDGKSEIVINILKKMKNMNKSEFNRYSKIIQDIFEIKYSCNGSNNFVFIEHIGTVINKENYFEEIKIYADLPKNNINLKASSKNVGHISSIESMIPNYLTNAKDFYLLKDGDLFFGALRRVKC